MGVFCFKLSGNQNKSPQGCTTLTNSVFNRRFQLHSHSLVNYGSVEIQFDYNFQNPMHIPVAEAHGLVQESILEILYPLFNVFLIHIFKGEEHMKVLERHTQKIQEERSDSLIIVIVHDENKRDNTNFYHRIENGILFIEICRFNELLDQ